MPIQIIRNDITKMQVDAIVSPGNRHLRSSGGVSGAIFKAAGLELERLCATLGGCGVGEVKLTPGFSLPCRYVIHTVSPVWQGGHSGEAELLAGCYRHSLELAVKHACRSIAFPMMGTGAHGYPKDEALRIAHDTIADFLFHHVPDNDLMVYLVTFTRESVLLGSKLHADIQQYIDDHYVEEHSDSNEYMRRRQARAALEDACLCGDSLLPLPTAAWEPSSLEEALNMVDESFSAMVLRKIGEKGMTNAECYHRANIDRKHFSKLVNHPDYKPKKGTALAIAVALRLSLDETRELLTKAGMALSHSSKMDIIVEYYIARGQYDINSINDTLYDYDQPLLGGAIL